MVEEDGELAFNLQMMEVRAASLGVDLGGDDDDHSVDDPDLSACLRLQRAWLQQWQQEESDRLVAHTQSREEARRMRQIERDRRLAEELNCTADGSTRKRKRAEENTAMHTEVLTPAVRGEVLTEPCGICMDDRYANEMMGLEGCSHRFCVYCVTQHAELKVREGIVKIKCPAVGCSSTFTTQECTRYLSKKSSDLLSNRLLDESIPQEHRVYCPYKDCSHVMDSRTLQRLSSSVPSSSALGSGMSDVQCGSCRKLFCLECKVAWHSDMSCETYQKLPPEFKDAEGAQLYKLAKDQKWMQCQKCRRVIELTQGCNHISCQCGFQFCYRCGDKWSDRHRSSTCPFWDMEKIITG